MPFENLEVDILQQGYQQVPLNNVVSLSPRYSARVSSVEMGTLTQNSRITPSVTQLSLPPLLPMGTLPPLFSQPFAPATPMAPPLVQYPGYMMAPLNSQPQIPMTRSLRQQQQLARTTQRAGQIYQAPPMSAGAAAPPPTPFAQEQLKTVLASTNTGYTINDFEIIKRLGAGSFGETFAVRNVRTGNTVVIKRIDKSKSPREMVQSEVGILRRLAGICQDYILCYKGYFEDAGNYYIITEFLGTFVTLNDFIKTHPASTLTEAQLNTIFENLIYGIDEIHNSGVAHRDIKPDNILIDPNTLQTKYIDFGISCYDQDCSKQSVVNGTPIYMPPEFILATAQPGLKTMQLGDIWSLGMTFFDIIAGKPFFEILITLMQQQFGQVPPFMEVIRYTLSNWTFFDTFMNQFMNTIPVNDRYKFAITACLRQNPQDRDLTTSLNFVQSM